MSDPFQKRWLLRQTLMYGRAEDIGALDIEEIRRELDQLDLPKEIESLWQRYLEYLDAFRESISQENRTRAHGFSSGFVRASATNFPPVFYSRAGG